MNKIFDRVKALTPKSVGVEIETQRQIAEALKGKEGSYNRPIDSFPMMSFASHSESSKILELNTIPADLSNPQDVLLLGELVRQFNPFQFMGGGDACSGSCHCHVNIGGDKSGMMGSLAAETYWSLPVQAAMLPFMTIGYMKHGEMYDFRDRRSSITQDRIYTTGRGTGMMINCGINYANYGLEYRANENAPLWAYLLAPIVALIESDDSLYQKLRDIRRRHVSANRVPFRSNIPYMKEALKVIRPMLLDNMELITCQVTGTDKKEFLKVLMKAYLTEDIEMYNKILSSVLSKNVKTRVLLDYIHQNFVNKYESSMLSSVYNKTKDIKFLNSVYPEINF